LSQFDFNLLAALDALLHERSVTLAAARLGVSQPTMSGMLRRLRDQFRDPLLVRGKLGYELTPRAEDIAEKTRQALLLIEDLVSPPEFDLKKLKRHFVIMASEFSMFLILPRVCRQATIDAPGVTFEFVPISNPPSSVYAGDVDLAMSGDTLAYVEGAQANVVRTQVLAADRFVGLVDASHPLNGDITLDQFYSYPHVVTQFHGMPRSVEDNFLELSSEHSPRIRVPSFLSVGPLVAGTDMIGLVPSLLTPLLLGIRNLKVVIPPAEIAAAPLRSLWHARHDDDPAHQWLRSTIAAASVRLAHEGSEDIAS
jgi:DNA-binding transcriptional LysR family regulator